jgi:hypothetical protein
VCGWLKHHKVDNPYLITFLLRKLIFDSDLCFGVAPRMDIKKTCLQEIGLRAQNMITFLGSVVNLFGESYTTI